MGTIHSETNKVWSNWSGSVTFTPKQILYPKSIEEIVLIIRRTKHAGKYLRVVGSGYSLPPLVMTDQVLVSLDKLTGIESINTEEHTATVFAGTTLSDLTDSLAASGYALENLGDANAQSIAGTLSTGTHGTGLHFGILSTQVVAYTIVTAEGKIMECAIGKNEELFRAAQLSLGLLGIIVKITLRVVPSYRLHMRTFRMELEQCLAEIGQLCAEHRNVEFLWYPYTKTALVKTYNTTEDPISEHKKWQELRSHVKESYVFGFLSFLCILFPKLNKTVSRYIAEAMLEEDKIDDSPNIYVQQQPIRFHEIEYFIPLEHVQSVVKEIEETIEREQYEVHLALQCRFVKGDDVWLSPAYQRDSAAISLRIHTGVPYEHFFRTMEAIFLQYEGRPHWGKWHSLTREKAEALFPKLVDFRNLRVLFDPYDSFLNPYLFKIFSRDRANVTTEIFSVEQTVEAVRAIGNEV